MELLEELSQYLHLTKTISLQVGSRINVGEHFTVRFTLINSAPAPITVNQRLIRFRKPYLQIVKTPYARPCMPDGAAVDALGNNFPNDPIDPGEGTFMEFKMLATADIQGWSDLFLQERIADAYVHAHLDVGEYFKVMRTYAVRTEIDS